MYHHINIEHLRGTEIHNELIKVHFTDRIESDDQIYGFIVYTKDIEDALTIILKLKKDNDTHKFLCNCSV
mgnify:CR=1 FL=1